MVVNNVLFLIRAMVCKLQTTHNLYSVYFSEKHNFLAPQHEIRTSWNDARLQLILQKSLQQKTIKFIFLVTNCLIFVALVVLSLHLEVSL